MSMYDTITQGDKKKAPKQNFIPKQKYVQCELKTTLGPMESRIIQLCAFEETQFLISLFIHKPLKCKVYEHTTQ